MPGKKLPIAVQQHHLPGLEQRIVIRTHVADRVALQLQAAMLPLLFLHVILRVRKRCDHLIAAPHRIPATVVKMQVRIDDDVDIFRRDSGGVQVVEQLGRLFEDLDQAVRQFVADASLDQNVLLAGAHKQRIQSRVEPVLLVRRDLLRPHGLRNDSEKGSAIEEVSSIGDDCEFEIAESCAMHKAAFRN